MVDLMQIINKKYQYKDFAMNLIEQIINISTISRENKNTGKYYIKSDIKLFIKSFLLEFLTHLT